MAYFGYSSNEKHEIASQANNAALNKREKIEDIKIYW